MDRRTKNIVLMVVVLAAFAIGAIALEPTERVSTGSIAMLDIGQGDSFLITAPSGAQLLIDGGKDSKVLTELAKVMPSGDHSIDVVIATHPDADHIGGLPLVVDRYTIGLFLTSQVAGTTDTYRDLMRRLLDHNVPSYFARAGMDVRLDDTTHFRILFPDRDVTNWETNTASVVGRLDIGSRSALFTGDSPISIEQYLVKTRPSDIDVDILKLGHHGSKTSSSELFLQKTSPLLALISAGVNNSYGHPHQEVLDVLKKLRIPSVSTQDAGTYILATDGTTWTHSK